MEHSRAKLNNETNVDLVSSLGGEQDNSLSSYEDQLVVGVRKTDISESVETSSLELMPESSLTPSYFKSSSSSTSLLSSGSSSTLPSTTSATINENNNVETSEPGKTNVLHNISPDTDKISALQAINDENNRVIATDLTIDVARKIARAYNKKHKSDIFTINSQTHWESNPKNGEEVSELIKREIKKFLTEMIKKYPNDGDLGAGIRKLYK